MKIADHGAPHTRAVLQTVLEFCILKEKKTSMEKIHLQVSSEQEGLEALIMFGKSDSPRHGTGPSSAGSWDAQLFYPWKNRLSLLRGCS